MITRHTLGLLIGLIACSLLVSHAEGAIHKVIIYKEGREVAQGLGVWVAGDALLTSSAIVSLGDQVFIEDSAGTRYLAKLRSQSGALALLSVDGLSIGSTATLAPEPPQENSDVYFPRLDGSQRKGLLLFEATGDSIWDHRYIFTMSVDSADIGAPLVNRCEQLISVVAAQADSDGNLVGKGESYDAIVSFLNADSVTFAGASSPCPSFEDQISKEKELREALQGNLDSLKNELKSLEDLGDANLEQSEEERRRLESQKNALEQRITETEESLAKQDSILQGNERLQDSLKTDLDSLRQRSIMQSDSLNAQKEQRRRDLLLVGLIAALLLLSVIVVLIVIWKRKRDMEEELEDANIRRQEAEEAIDKKPEPFPDLLLFGLGPDKEKIRVKVSGAALLQNSKGLILGRSSAHADCVIVEESVSRRHARISLVDRKLIIQDMGSLNGTTVNGIELTPEKIYPLPKNAKITLGEVELEISILK